MGVCVPEEHGGAGADFLSYVLVLEELSRGRRRRRRDRRRAHERVHAAAARPRLAVRAGAGGRRGDRGVRADRGRAPARTRARCARASPTAASPAPSSGSPTARTPRRSSSSRARGRADQRVRRARRRRRLRGHARGGEARAELLLDRRPRVRGHAGRAARRAGQGDARSRCGRSTAAASGSPRRRSGSRRPALELATSYAKERHAFGGPIAQLGAIQQKLADMQTEIEAARALVWRAARLKDAGRPHTVEGAQAKLFASRGRAPLDRRGDPGPRRLRLHEGVPGRALLPRREGHRDLRGDVARSSGW